MKPRGIAALLAAGSLTIAAVAGAQTSGSGSSSTGTGSSSSGAAGTSGAQGSQSSSTRQEVTGTIKSIDADKLVLEDGTELMLPATASIDRSELKEGSKVRVSYEDRGGQKVVTSVQPGS
jgi:hypothetical protein